MAIDPMSAKMAAGILRACSMAQSAADGGEKNPINKIAVSVLILLMLFFLLVAALIEIIITPACWVGNMLGFKDKYKNNLTAYATLNEFAGQYPMPCDSSVITSDYGTRVHPVTGVVKKHTGIDLAASWHSPIISIADGEVVRVGVDRSFGRNVTIKHKENGETFYSFYAHLSKINVVKRQTVKQFQIIGHEGGDPKRDTLVGKSTGHHLHFEIRKTPKYGSDVDPKIYLMGNNKEGEKDNE